MTSTTTAKNTAAAPTTLSPEQTIQTAFDTFAAATFGPGAWAKWTTPLYALVRGDKGNGAARVALTDSKGKAVTTRTGKPAPWAVVCRHGRVTGFGTGGAAHTAAANGALSALGCTGCKAESVATVPGLPGAPALVSAPRTPRKPRTAPAPKAQAPQAPAPAEAPAPTV